MTTQLQKCLSDWNCKILFQANWNATDNGGQIKEYVDGDIKIRLHAKGSSFFIEERIGKTMYPSIFKVEYTPEPELTEADFQEWLKTHQ